MTKLVVNDDDLTLEIDKTGIHEEDNGVHISPELFYDLVARMNGKSFGHLPLEDYGYNPKAKVQPWVYDTNSEVLGKLRGDINGELYVDSGTALINVNDMQQEVLVIQSKKKPTPETIKKLVTTWRNGDDGIVNGFEVEANKSGISIGCQKVTAKMVNKVAAALKAEIKGTKPKTKKKVAKKRVKKTSMIAA